MAAAGSRGRGQFRASHADRERVIGILKTAFVQGRLTEDELGARVDQVYASRTYAEPDALTADVPAADVSAAPAVDRSRARFSSFSRASCPDTARDTAGAGRHVTSASGVVFWGWLGVGMLLRGEHGRHPEHWVWSGQVVRR